MVPPKQGKPADTSTASLRERAWYLFKEVIDPIASFVGVIVILLAGIRYFINAEVADVRNEVTSLKDNVVGHRGDLGKRNDRIDGVFSKALERLIPQPTANKSTIRGSLHQVKELFELAKTQNIKVDPKVISRYGTAVANLTTNPSVSSVAWDTLTSLLTYRSFLNVDFAPKVGNRIRYSYPLNVPWEEGGYNPPLHTRAYYGGGKASSDESARIERLDWGSPFKEGSGYIYTS
jgi:hypothetical protein